MKRCSRPTFAPAYAEGEFQAAEKLVQAASMISAQPIALQLRFLQNKGLTIVEVDDSPNSLEGIKDRKVLASHSQRFWLQGYLPMEMLYFYKKMGICPLDDIITGPIVINQSNVDNWIKNVKGIIGEEAYKKQITW